MTTQAKKAAAAFVQVMSWVYQVAKTLWQALKPVWGVFTTMWEHLKPVISRMAEVWSWMQSALSNIYQTYIRPIWDAVTPLISRLDDAMDWVQTLYENTIGRIEAVYDTLFGQWEDAWNRITDTEERIVRMIGVFSDDLAASIDSSYDRLYQTMVGQIQDVRDNITAQIDDVYWYIRSTIADTYYSIMDVINPLQDDVSALEDFLDLKFEPSGSVSRDTVVTTADTYGQDWWASIDHQQTQATSIGEVDVNIYSETEKSIDEVIDNINAGASGPWGDVSVCVDSNIQLLDLHMDPIPIRIREDLLEDGEVDMYNFFSEEDIP